VDGPQDGDDELCDQIPETEATVLGDPGCLEEVPVEEVLAEPDSMPRPSNVDLDGLSDLGCLEDIKTAMAFINALRGTSLDDDHNKLSRDAVERLRNPPTSPSDVNDDFRLGLDLFLAHLNSSQEAYNKTREAIHRRHPDDKIPSYDQMKCRIAEMTGVVPIVHHMCPNTCLAFTGPFVNDESCRMCGHP
jgi:hypothetical protein